MTPNPTAPKSRPFSDAAFQGAASLMASLIDIAPAERPDAVAMFVRASLDTRYLTREPFVRPMAEELA